MSQGQDSNFLAIFDLLYSFSGPQKLQHKIGQKFISLGSKNITLTDRMALIQPYGYRPRRQI